jgi:deoxyribonuclease IV
MPILGCHTSIAGGYHRAVERAAAVGCDCVQLFTGSPRSFSASSIKASLSAANAVAADEAERFREALRVSGITHPLAHDGYLINLASPDRRLWQKSVEAFIAELHRAEQLGIPYVVTHPGAFTTADEQTGLRNIVRAIDEATAQTRGLRVGCLLETTSGQGTALGWRFEQLAAILDGLQSPERLGVCFDTCHVFAAGYPLGTPQEYDSTMVAFDRLLGVARIKAFHLNDSRRELGSRIDRHEHIGRGQLGIEPFRLLLNDPRFRDVPMYLETPKGRQGKQDWDAVNLRTLRDCLV